MVHAFVRRLLPYLALVLVAGCEHFPAPEAPARTHIAGVRVVERPAGGRGRAFPVDTDPLGLDGSRGTCDTPVDEALLAGCEASGRGRGFGANGLGLGGRGAGGAGIGLGRTRVVGGGRARVGRTEEPEVRRRLSVSPWGWAQLELPFRGGAPARFETRVDARVNRSVRAAVDELSTFAVDVDTAAYSLARRALMSGTMPDPTSVRVEEFLNYFRYRYRPPVGRRDLFAIEADGAEAPTEDGRYLLRVGLAARQGQRPPANLVFLVDTSCSMTGSDRLGLVKESLAVALANLRADDRVAVATYAGGVQLVLPPTPASQPQRILDRLDALETAGGTAMESGLDLAYRQARSMQRPGELTRIIVCSDGDANIGATKPDALLDRVAEHVEAGVTLSTVGFGTGNYRDGMMETLANRGNGNYFYVDGPRQAARVFGRDLDEMLYDVARDVKVQVALSNDAVRSWRLVGYENRHLEDDEFRDDAVDAGEIGAGHQVTALYELDLVSGAGGSLGTIRVRAKRPGQEDAKEVRLEVPVALVRRPFGTAPDDLRFAAAVMGGAELLRGGPGAARWSYDQVLSVVEGALREHEDEDRREFVALMARAATLSARP